MSPPIRLRVEKWDVIGFTTGYRIECAGCCCRDTSLGHGPVKDVGTHDPLTNAQRGVMWLKNEGMVRETAKTVPA